MPHFALRYTALTPIGRDPMNEHIPANPLPDYSKTLFLPKTDFPMRAGLPKKEPEILAHWQAIDLYGRLRAQGRPREKFVLHDGPPYANGNIHIGHALNKILKDLVTRSQQMAGKDSNYVPGWDCHGLPIEWRIEEAYRAKGRNKDDVPIVDFRQECRAFAAKWLDVQREEFQRLGVTGDWANPYLTMSFPAEAAIAAEIHKFAANGLLYRGSKPVMWSVVEKTALAEAEVEYEDHVSDTVFVAFPVRAAQVEHRIESERLDRSGRVTGVDYVVANRDLLDASVVIWTTTPWTIPANRAISYSRKIPYGSLSCNGGGTGRKLGEDRRCSIFSPMRSPKAPSGRPRSTRSRRCAPLRRTNSPASPRRIRSRASMPEGYAFEVPLLDGDHVTDEAGTGFVHTAPSHGRDDFDIWMARNKWLRDRKIDTRIPYTVDADGFLTKDAPGFEGRRVIDDKGAKGDANDAVIKALIAAGTLVARGPAEAPISAFLAFEEAADLPQHAAMVHRPRPALRHGRHDVAGSG